jgi:hypothetical protein
MLHAKGQVTMSDTEYFGRTQVGTISSPALGQGEVGGTSHLNNAAGRSRPRKGQIGSTASVSKVSSPLNTTNHLEILKAAGLGRRTPQKMGPGEQMSDADQPTQSVEAQPDGSMMHHRANTDGSVTSSPMPGSVLGNYSHLSYDTDMAAMQARMGVPNFFGNGA